MFEKQMMGLVEKAMGAALEEARAAKKHGELPYGAVIMASDGTLVSRAHDSVLEHDDPTRHAEIDAVRLAIANTHGDLSDHILVSTGEPCAMCSAAAWWAGIRTMAFGLSMLELKALMPNSMPDVIGPIEILNHDLTDRINVMPGILRQQCLSLWGLDDQE